MTDETREPATAAAAAAAEAPKRVLLTDKQAAAEFPQWSAQKIQRLRLSGKIPYFPGRPPLIDRADLERLKVGGVKEVGATVAAVAEAAVKRALNEVRHEPTEMEKAEQRARAKWLRLRRS